jgi:predicted PurR-regulated permease PerM
VAAGLQRPDAMQDQVTPNPPAPAAVVRPSGVPELRSLLSLAVAAIVIAALFVAQDVLIPIILAVMVSFLLSPVVTALGKTGLSRAPSVILTVLMTFGVIAVAVTLLATQTSTLAADAPRYAATVQQKLDSVELLATSRMASLTRTFGSGIARRGPAVPPATSPAPPPAIAARPPDAASLAAVATASQREPVLVQIARSDTSPLVAVRSIVEPVLGPLETTVIVLVIAIFILMEREDLRDRFIRVAGSNDLQRTTAAMDDAGQRLSRYFLSQFAVNGTFGLVIGVGLWVIGVPSPALWGVLAGLLRFVPYIGPILAAFPPLALAAAIDPGWWRLIEVGLLFVVIEPVTGYVVEPLLYGHSTGLAPVSVIVAAVFWTWIWGPIGLILSTPLTLCLVVMGRHVKSLEFFDVLLGDRPALAPVENLYQRILADNPDEVLEKAEVLLADRTLLDYYDTVMLEALELAAHDEARGVVSRERATEMSASLMHVIGDLASHVDRPIAPSSGIAQTAPDGGNPPAQTAGTVACISGRGPFDDVITAMLSQLLERGGVRTRRVPYREVSRDRIAQVDLTGVTVIALSYLDMSASPPSLKYLVRRLRQHAPLAKIVVGLWPAERADAVDDRRAIGADQYFGSLREALTTIGGANAA